jgi:hypothetical protein
MAIRASFVTGKARCGRVIGALVTGVAGNGAVASAAMKELGVVELRALG